jgi:hypothetical protein
MSACAVTFTAFNGAVGGDVVRLADACKLAQLQRYTHWLRVCGCVADCIHSGVKCGAPAAAKYKLVAPVDSPAYHLGISTTTAQEKSTASYHYVEICN